MVGTTLGCALSGVAVGDCESSTLLLGSMVGIAFGLGEGPKLGCALSRLLSISCAVGDSVCEEFAAVGKDDDVGEVVGSWDRSSIA